MKKTILVKNLLMGTVLLGLTTSLGAAPISTPTTNSFKGKATPTVKHYSQLHLVDKRIHDAYINIGHAVKNKKMSASQGTSLKAQMKTIRQQLAGFMKQNKASAPTGTRVDLTASQASQLNQSLDPITQSIPTK